MFDEKNNHYTQTWKRSNSYNIIDWTVHSPDVKIDTYRDSYYNISDHIAIINFIEIKHDHDKFKYKYNPTYQIHAININKNLSKYNHCKTALYSFLSKNKEIANVFQNIDITVQDKWDILQNKF